jgi:hypothetical protein
MKVITKITIVEKSVKPSALTENALKEYKDSVYDYLAYEFDESQEIKIDVEIEEEIK